MKLRCQLFGHKMPVGYCGGNPYLKIWTIVTDGINREHAFLEAECPRCGEKYTVAMVHLPQGTQALWRAEYLKNFEERNRREKEEFNRTHGSA